MRRGLLVAGAAVLVVGVVLLAVRSVDGAADVAAPRPTPVVAAPLSPPGGVVDFSVGERLAPPAGLRFVSEAQVELPYSDDGPSDVRGPVAAGYTYTVQGAAVAAVQISYRIRFLPDAEQVVAAQVDGSDAFRRQLLDARTPAPTGPVDAPVAFSCLCTSGSAVVLLAVPDSPGSWTVTPVKLRWEDGDWKLVEDPENPTLVVSDLSGFTTW